MRLRYETQSDIVHHGFGIALFALGLKTRLLSTVTEHDVFRFPAFPHSEPGLKKKPNYKKTAKLMTGANKSVCLDFKQNKYLSSRNPFLGHTELIYGCI
jgi:hypothetical protein